MPYLALADRLRAFLRRANPVFVTCGYSFRDDHLNEVLRDGLERNATAVSFALLHGEMSRYPKAIAVARRVGNLVLLARNEAVVGRALGEWQAPDAELEDPMPGVEVTDGTVAFRLGDFAVTAGLLRQFTGSAA